DRRAPRRRRLRPPRRVGSGHADPGFALTRASIRPGGRRRGAAGGLELKILVVDDAPEVVESVSVGLSLHWREVDVLGAPDGRSALDLIESESPDLVLLDVGLPDMD